MATVSVNPPKTPATKGSNGTAPATVPNVCKMPGPPAPFVPTPQPNIGKTSISPTGYSKTVKIEGQPVAIRGASFGSTGDGASKATGGGMVSANTHGPTKFVGTGSLDVKIEGKNVHFLSDPLLNNCGPSGSPPNAATLAGLMQEALMTAIELNPGNTKGCGAGNHVEQVYFPDVPKDEISVLARIAKLEQVAGDAGEVYEAAAARHNHAAGTLDHGKQISRRLTPEELAAGHHPDSQKVWAICSVCGYRREIDHAEKDGKHTVDAKSGRDPNKSGPQRTNNAAFAAKPGHGVTYKVPQIARSAENALKRRGLSVIQTGG